MKRKLTCLLLTLIMVLAMMAPAFAAGEGSITIDNAVVGQTYTIYRILDLESYNADTNAYSYKANAAWKVFVESDGIKDVYLTTDTQGYVTWVEGADAAAFAKLAQAYAANPANNITPVDAKTAGTPTVSFTGLDLGYYLVDSTLGTLCSLDTTNPAATIEEKNAAPTNEKTVEEDSTGDYGKVNDADIGQTVNFRSTIIAQTGAQNYVFHDKMSAGLTFNTESVKVTLNKNAVATTNYTVVTSGLTDGCTFHVVFHQDFCDTLKANDEIVISYSATVNANAVIGDVGNPNESHLSYGEDSKTSTVPSTTKTYTWDMEVLKYGNGDKTKLLKDAQFVILNSTKDKVATVANGKVTGWVDVPAAGEDGVITWPANAVLTTDAQGNIHVSGLDADTYYLREVQAPAGYNKLAGDIEFKIVPTTGENNTLTYTTVVAEINNQSGSELPSTGGMGTTLFYILGSVLVLGTVVLLITRKRMRANG